MEVLLLTTLFSIVFAILFLTLFLRERQTRGFGGIERDALMPLDDGDEPGPPVSKKASQSAGEPESDGNCGVGCPCQE